MITGTLFFTWLKGQLVGTDKYGNRYYQERKKPAQNRRQKRWVLYKGMVDGSKVPAQWHAWLSHTVDTPIQTDSREWEKNHIPNLSGTAHAYFPPGDDRGGACRPAATGDYQAWQPDRL